MDFTPDKLAEIDAQLTKVSYEAADAIHDAEVLYETGKDYLAEIMTEIEKKNEEKVSDTKLERLARASEKWKKFREGLFAAQHKANTLKVKMKNGERLWSTIQSGVSYRKEELKRAVVG